MTSVDGITTGVVETARELGLEVEPGDVAGLLLLLIKLEWMSCRFLP